MTVNNIDAATVKIWLDNNEAVLIDVRELQEYKANNIPHSVLIPLAQISFAALPALSGQKLVIHCQSGKRSASACLALAPEIANVYNLDGGIIAWEQAGFLTNKIGN